MAKSVKPNEKSDNFTGYLLSQAEKARENLRNLRAQSSHLITAVENNKSALEAWLMKYPKGQSNPTAEEYTLRNENSIKISQKTLETHYANIAQQEAELEEIENNLAQAQSHEDERTEQRRQAEAAEVQAQRDHEAKLRMIALEEKQLELAFLREQRLAAEAARDAAAIAKAQESEQFASILKGLKDDNT